jgi:acyl-CoA dehydrogenase
MAQTYFAPLADMRFLLHSHQPRQADDAMQVLSELATFAEEQWAPVNATGDAVGCTFQQGRVTLPAGIKEALRRYLDGGWVGMTLPESCGGQALSATLGCFAGEILNSANPALSMFSALTTSAAKTILTSGSDTLKDTYLPKMVSGEWTGTMCMTEAHCGSDLGLIKTTAAHTDDGDYAISGTKIFISAGEHDGSTNIVHLVLARIKGAP